MTPCPHAPNGCNYPEGECSGACRSPALVAIPDDWTPTAENINALPGPLRRFIHDLAANADPAGTVRELAQMKDVCRELEASNRMLRDAAPVAQQAYHAKVNGNLRFEIESLTKERDHWRQRAQAAYEKDKGEVWYWQGDGADHPESMVNSLTVVIRADQLRALMAVPVGHAGVIIWAGDRQVKRLLTEAEIKSAQSPGFALSVAALQCLDEVAAPQQPAPTTWERKRPDDSEGGAL